MTKELVIVFVKNMNPGKVKTRLAKSIGDEGALDVYKALIKITESALHQLEAKVHIYYSENLDNTTWINFHKELQEGDNLGERMKNAFQNGFDAGFERIVLIGSDLPDISSTHINQGLEALKNSDVVFGPAKDGGYYLIGLRKMHHSIFENKPWSQPNLLQITLQELHKKDIKVSTLEVLNDIDTYEDLLASEFFKNNKALQIKINQLHD